MILHMGLSESSELLLLWFMIIFLTRMAILCTSPNCWLCLPFYPSAFAHQLEHRPGKKSWSSHHALPQWDRAFDGYPVAIPPLHGVPSRPQMGFHLNGIDDAEEQFQCIEGVLPEWMLRCSKCRINQGGIIFCSLEMLGDMMGQFLWRTPWGMFTSVSSMAYTQHQGSSHYGCVFHPLINGKNLAYGITTDSPKQLGVGNCATPSSQSTPSKPSPCHGNSYESHTIIVQ